LTAIPHDSLKTVIDESYSAVGGLGSELSRLVKGTTTLASDARAYLDALTTVIDKSPSLLDTQIDSSDAIQTWAANTATITRQLQAQDTALKGVLAKGPAAADEARSLIEKLLPTVPILLTNLVSITDVAVTYQPNLEQLLVLLPPGVEIIQGSELMDRNVPQYKGLNISFNLNLNLPPPCTTGYLPAQQVRSASEADYPARPAGDLYCRVPQDSPLNVRGVRNIPCETKPGKRAPTVKLCESDENYVPLNDGFNWKGDPNATLSGQAVPQLSPSVPPTPISVANYDPATGTYIGPDGKQYTQANLAQNAPQHPTLQDLLIPPHGK
jgi:phospholipid/cholesterol/gamma-HCH transport system substrate-binding protein